jgi:hypothetical protein
VSQSTNFTHYRTGAIALKQLQVDAGLNTRSQPAILSVLHHGPKVMLETEVSLRLSPSVQDPGHRVQITGVDVGEVSAATWNEGFRAMADRLRRAAESLEAAASGAHLCLPITSIHPDLAKARPSVPEPSDEEPSE